MAVTFGQMTLRILRETSRDASMEEGVQDAIVTAIKELEREQYWLFEKVGDIALLEGTDNVDLPTDFAEMSTLRLLFNDTYRTQMFGFTPVTNHEIFNFVRQNNPGVPYMWSIYGNKIYVYPFASGNYTLNLHYYYKDTVYPSLFSDSSIWLDDLTEDLTRYKALAIFYRDSLQAEEKAMFYEQKAENAVSNMRIRNNQRLQINRLSI
jgi:hypothetical protein